MFIKEIKTENKWARRMKSKKINLGKAEKVILERQDKKVDYQKQSWFFAKTHNLDKGIKKLITKTK